jgi:hypothetical protein
MKTAKKLRVAALIPLLFILSCQHDAHEDEFISTSINSSEAIAVENASPASNCNPNAYEVTLESKTFVDGKWEWVWSVRNPNPGNGSNGTSKDLSHWSIDLGECINESMLTAAAYSADGINWTGFTPSIKVETSAPCISTPVLKFDFGTWDTQKSYYKLVLNQDFALGNSTGYYKAAHLCCSFVFTGISCSGPVELEIIE